MKKFVIIAAVLILAAWLTYEMFSLAKTECSLCLTFNGLRQCSHAQGPDEKAAQEEAKRTICAQLASGVTQAVACEKEAPEDIHCGPPNSSK